MCQHAKQRKKKKCPCVNPYIPTFTAQASATCPCGVLGARKNGENPALPPQHVVTHVSPQGSFQENEFHLVDSTSSCFPEFWFRESFWVWDDVGPDAALKLTVWFVLGGSFTETSACWKFEYLNNLLFPWENQGREITNTRVKGCSDVGNVLCPDRRTKLCIQDTEEAASVSVIGSSGRVLSPEALLNQELSWARAPPWSESLIWTELVPEPLRYLN